MSVAAMTYRQEYWEHSGSYQGPSIGLGKMTNPGVGGGGVIVTFGVDRAIITG